MSAEPQKLHASAATIDPADIRWRVGQISKKDPHKGSLLGYIDARTCMEALDALDPEWSAVHGDPIIVGDVLVGVPCRVTVNGVTRSDVGMPSSQEPIKGAYSDALKRAAVHFGIGRELYELPRIYVKLDDYKKPVAIPTYRNGRWTLPSKAGSVFYDREPDDNPEPSARGGAPSSPSGAATPAPAPRSAEEQRLVDEIAAAPGMTHARMSLLADRVGVKRGERATVAQLNAMLDILNEPPDFGTPQPSGSAHPDGAATEQDEPRDSSVGEAGTEAVSPDMPEASDPPPVAAPPAPSLDDVLAAAGPGAEVVPPKPRTPEYGALSPAEKASARAFWAEREVEAKHKPDAEQLKAAVS